jgi:hypothetical protein
MPKFHLRGAFTGSSELALLPALAAASVVFGLLHFENIVPKRFGETRTKKPPKRKGLEEARVQMSC